MVYSLKINIDLDKHSFSMLYAALGVWCLDMGYIHYMPHDSTYECDLLYFFNSDRNLIILQTNNKDIIDKVKSTWIDDGELHVVSPKFEYYNGPIMYNIHKNLPLDKAIGWLENNIVRDDYRIYYLGVVRMLSFRYIKDLMFYKMVFFNNA